jgi:succinoglycan biosynthesis transport protein ExoP
MNEQTTTSLDLIRPASQFVAASRLHGRAHRSRLFLRKRWWIPLFFLVLVLGPVCYFSAGLPPTYQSTAKMWLPTRLNLSENRLYSEDPGNFLATQSELLRSQLLQDRALARLNRQFPGHPALNPVPGQAPPWKEFLASSIGQVESVLHYSPPKAPNSPTAFPFSLKVIESYKNSLVDLKAQGSDPQLTQAFLNQLMQAYVDFKRQVREESTTRAAASMNSQLATLKADLQAQQEKLHSFQSSNNVVFLQEQGNSAGNYLGNINRQLAVLKTEYQLLQTLEPQHLLELSSKPAGAEPNIPVGGLPSVRELQPLLAASQGDFLKASQQMELLKSKRDELLQFLKPPHPKIIKLTEGIAAQQKVMELARQEQAKVLANRRQSVGLEVQNLEAAFREWDTKALQASRKLADYERIRLDLQHTQAAYDRVLGLIQNLDLSKNLDQENLAVLEPGSPPLYRNLMLRNILIGLAASLLLGSGVLYGAAKLDDRFASIEELRGYFSENVVGYIPEISLRRPNGKFGLDSLHKARFEFLESFRTLRSALLFTGQGDSPPKTILVASSVPEEGKSTVSLYFAAVLAMGGARVLLVDADLRRASLHRNFGAEPGPGLAEILASGGDPAQCIVSTSLEGLSFLPAGRPDRNPGELFLNPNLNSLFHRIYPQFDFIILNTPPVLATDDASTLAPNVDGVLFVVRGSFTSARKAHQALELLRQRKVNILGLVFNRAISSANERHSYTAYRSAYQWKPKRRRPSQTQTKPDSVAQNGSKKAHHHLVER